MGGLYIFIYNHSGGIMCIKRKVIVLLLWLYIYIYIFFKKKGIINGKENKMLLIS